VPQIGFIGLGRMGFPICATLTGAGYPVIATDKRPDLAGPATACGAMWRDTPAEAAATADVLITMLPGPREVQAAMLGTAGAVETLTAGCNPDRYDQQLTRRRRADT
jgi:3-hydroxyisobutyrate dehydrogenase